MIDTAHPCAAPCGRTSCVQICSLQICDSDRLSRSSPFEQLRCPDSLRDSVRPWPPIYSKKIRQLLTGVWPCTFGLRKFRVIRYAHLIQTQPARSSRIGSTTCPKCGSEAMRYLGHANHQFGSIAERHGMGVK